MLKWCLELAELQPEHRVDGIRYRTLSTLSQLYTNEGLPEATSKERLTAGEKRMLQEQNVEPFVDSLRVLNRELKNKGIRTKTKSQDIASESMEAAT